MADDDRTNDRIIDRITVEPADVFDETQVHARTVGQVRRLSPIQQAGLVLAGGVGCVITVVIAVVLFDWWASAPPLPQLPTSVTAGDRALSTALLADYKALSEAATARSTQLFDTVVVKALLPIFTAILGYIFGSRDAGEGRDGG